jgi:hypothetical protein
MRIGVDFDRVLFETDSFNEYIENQVEGLEKVDTPPYNEHGVYSPEIHAKMCGIDTEDIYEAMENLERFLYDDSEQLKQSDHEIVLVSRGQPKFQKRKMEASGAKKLVDEVIVIQKGAKDVKDIEFLIDDRKKELEKAGVPGFEFDRKQHSLEDALKEAEKHATG